jgi:hypothetical protein
MKKIFIYLLVLIPAIQGCKKFLGITPKGFTIPQYYQDYVQLMNYAQLQKAGDEYPALLTDDIQYSSADSLYSYNQDIESNQRLYTFAHGAVFNDGVSDNIWEGAYARIFYFNVVINHIENAPDATDAQKANLKAEALFARAFEYFNLLITYSKPYNEATAGTDYGIPLVINDEDVGSLTYTRNTVAEAYAKIDADLTEALPNLLSVVPNSNTFRPSKAVGYAFRARVYLYKGDFANALINAKASVALNSSLVNLNNYGIKDSTTAIGRICLLPLLVTPYPEGINNPENIYARYLPHVFGMNEALYASNDLLSIYGKDLALGQIDKRRVLWYSDNSFSTDQFPGRTTYCAFIRSNVGLTTMEAILTAAECYARSGSSSDLTEAARLYNLLRQNRISNYQNVTFTSANDALFKILSERRREFAFVGSFRFFDLKRLNNEQAFAKTVIHTVNGTTYTLPPGDLRYVIPVPPKVKAFNPNMPDYLR